MNKNKNTKKDDKCIHAIYPLGKGLPLCSFPVTKRGKAEGVTLKDFPVCKEKGRCYADESSL